MKRFNRKTAVFAAMMCLVLAIAMVLPMAVFAEDSETEPVLGYGFSDNGYISDWAGQKVHQASWGAWATNEGQYNGAFFWVNDFDKVVKDENGNLPADGTITFKEAAAGQQVKFFPGQIGNNGLKDGPAFLSFEFYYEPGTYTKEGKEVTNFAGVTFTGDKNVVYFCVDNENGKIYYGNNLESAKQDPTKHYLGQFKEGWNTVELVFMPRDKDGKVVVSLAEGQKAEEVIARNQIYIRTYHESAPLGETYGFTDAELVANFKTFDYSNKNFYSTLGENGWLKVVQQGAGEMKIGSAKAINLIPDTPMYEVTYEGYKNDDGVQVNLMQHVKVDSSNNAVFAIPATIAGTTDPVQMWMYTDAEGTKSFYQPAVASRPGQPSNADIRMIVNKNMVLTVASGADLQVGVLGATMDKINRDFGVYTYVQLLGYIDELNAAATASQLDSSSPYIIKKDQLVEEMQTECDLRASSTEELILLAGDFIDESKSLEDRIDVFSEAENIYPKCDETYTNADTGATADVVAKAFVDYNDFRQSWENISEAWSAYRDGKTEILGATAGMDKATRYEEIISSYATIRKFFANYELDASVEGDYIANMTAMKTEFDALSTLKDMYDYLSKWAESWNSYKTTIYRTAKVDLPAALKGAVDAYNAKVTAINNEIFETAATAMAMLDQLVDNEAGLALISDIRSKIDRNIKNAGTAAEE